jgi:pilus assembly protein CpaF
VKEGDLMTTKSAGRGAGQGGKDWAKLKKYLIQTVQRELAALDSTAGDQRAAVRQRIEAAMKDAQVQLPEARRERLAVEVFHELVGYGPIQPLLEDPEISEVMVNGPELVFIEKDGELFETSIKFDDDDHVIRIINRMIHPLGKRVDSDTPNVDARLPDGARVNAVIPPVSVDGPLISIRKFLTNSMTVDDLVRLGSLTSHMSEFLKACVVARLNILISGPTSSGKTTMLNILSGFIPLQERIITIEDAVELQLAQRHIARLETRPPGVDGRGEITTRDLVRNALRMRPDRIVVGEVRSGEALDMLQAMNTGHSGSLTTLHANSPRDAISRLETMSMMAGFSIPLLAIRKQIAAAINLIVHQSRLEDGTRKTTRITEVVGMESDVVTLMDIFTFDRTGIGPDGKIQGRLKSTGIRPMFSPRLIAAGYNLGPEIFGAF